MFALIGLAVPEHTKRYKNNKKLKNVLQLNHDKRKELIVVYGQYMQTGKVIIKSCVQI